MKERNSSYSLNILSLRNLDKSTFTFSVENSRARTQFELVLSILANNTIRVRMLEASPIRTRFVPPIGDVLVQEPKPYQHTYALWIYLLFYISFNLATFWNFEFQIELPLPKLQTVVPLTSAGPHQRLVIRRYSSELTLSHSALTFMWT